MKKANLDKITKIDLGCGAYKKSGFFGIDISKAPGVDLVMDIEKQKLPFADNQIEHVFTSHMFEHIRNYPFVLQEIFRVCKPDALVEIWTPYGKANEAYLFEHDQFFTETHFKYICYMQDRYFLGKKHGYFLWDKTQYNLYPNILNDLKKQKISLGFALEHMFNIAVEWAVFLQVKKDEPSAPGPQYPGKIFSYGRDGIIKTTEPDDITPSLAQPKIPLARKAVKRLKPAGR